MSERLVKRVNVVGKGSLSVIIPKRWADALGIKPGDRIGLHFDGSRITIAPLASGEQGEEMSVLVECEPSRASINLAIRKLIASYVEGVTRAKVKASYETSLELSESLKDYVTSFVFMANPGSDTHELVFSDVKMDLPSLLKTIEATVSRLVDCFEERDPCVSTTYREFHRKYLYFLRTIKRGIAEGSTDPYEALDLTVSVEYVKELFDILLGVDQVKLREDAELPRVLELARAAVSAMLVQDIETAVSSVIKVLGLLEEVDCRSEVCGSVKYLTSRISELVLGRCIRNKACRCKHFFPKI